MVSALSGSDVGRSHLAQQFDLISDLLTLLHVGTTRLQRQVRTYRNVSNIVSSKLSYEN